MEIFDDFIINTVEPLSEENAQKYWGVITTALVDTFCYFHVLSFSKRQIHEKLLSSIKKYFKTKFMIDPNKILGEYKKGRRKKIRYYCIQLKHISDPKYYLEKDVVMNALPSNEFQHTFDGIQENDNSSTTILTKSIVGDNEIEAENVAGSRNNSIESTESPFIEQISAYKTEHVQFDNMTMDENSDTESEKRYQLSDSESDEEFVDHKLPSPPLKKRCHQVKKLPPLDSKEMKQYSLDRLQNMPARIKMLVNLKDLSSRTIGGFDLRNRAPLFITSTVRAELNRRGFVTVKNVVNESLLQELRRYIELKQMSENVDDSAYTWMCGPRGTIGLVTKYGWTKFDYNGPVQHILAAEPNLYVCMSELYGVNRLCPNFYEYKVSYPRFESTNLQFEFIHNDGNYRELLFAEQAGVDVDNAFYQVIVPLTAMHSDGATVYFAEGHWSRWGWKTCRPENQFLPEDVQPFITDKMVPAIANVGDIIIFRGVIPHGPNVNNSDSLRVAAYPFYAPLITLQNKNNPEKASCFLPNSLQEVKTCVETGKCPSFAAHPWTSYNLRSTSQRFFPTLPYRQLPRSSLADALFGFQPWSVFEKSDEAKSLFETNFSENRTSCVEKLIQISLNGLRSWNNTTQELLKIHRNHNSIVNPDCLLCARLQAANLAQWWHSTTAIQHKLAKCSCLRCVEVQKNGWQLWNTISKCTCTQCI